MKKSDPVGPEFYVPLGAAERLSAVAFYAAAALSIAVLLVNKSSQPDIYAAAQAAFAISVIVHFVSGIIIRTYFAVRAHSNRMADFVSNAFAVPLVPQPSQGYYTTTAEDPFLRMGASVLENSLFTKSIVRRMLRFERSRIALYGLIWLWAAFNRTTDLELLTVAAQVLFSEQLISRWVRMEWLRSRVERLYDEVYALIQSTTDFDSKEYRARAMEAVIRYETSKAQAGLSLSSRVFNQLDKELSGQWEATAGQLGLASSRTAKS
ncbi:hypothetical protein B9J07_27480 [Sinorhizobium sp. LM21]|nr:hypothetical protein B9J07_27480 [Sinorhizobium sp. LM21]